MTHHIAILPGDGIGPEIISQAVRVLDRLIADGRETERAALVVDARMPFAAPLIQAMQPLVGREVRDQVAHQRGRGEQQFV